MDVVAELARFASTFNVVNVAIALAAVLVVRAVVQLLGLDHGPIPQLKLQAPAEADPAWTPSKLPSKAPSIRDPSRPSVIICYDPATGYSLGEVPVVPPAEVARIVERARKAQEKYAQTTFEQRRMLLRTLLDWIVKNQETICRIAARDSGKSLIDANFGEILPTCEKLRWTIANGEEVLRSEQRTPGMIMAHKIPRVDYVPVGVMGCIVSWNYPFHNVFGPVISALMAGNACVVKCSEHVAWSTAFWQRLMSAALAANGLSEDLVVFMNGYAETGQALVETADKITFIGSPGVGKIIMAHASKTLTPVILELGGKDCAVVFEDCDYPQFRHNSMRYSFQNSGQNCAGLERVIIHESLFERFVEDSVKTLSKMRVGSPLAEDIDCGAITMAAQLGIIQTLVDDAISKGARVHVGGRQYKNPKFPHGQFYAPTLISGITKDMRIAHEEVFGPVMLVFSFKTEDEAVALANSTQFGLGSGVFTLDIARGERVARRLNVGFSNVNDFGVSYLCQGLPFGGVGISGVDRFSGVEGLRGNCNPRAMTTDKYNLLGIRTNLPGVLRYPIAPVGPRFQATLVELLYSYSPLSQIAALFRVAKISLLGSA
ncbi:Meiotic Sister-Chromatid recombination aldehyde dehydrogenase [Polyrhizophydium stewartii]|uniref:Meiotic Sister-Chromatid recombination aldehyde dehydrogenase n=1 Tax=Polyrhizophydium stewartii TaxID=2732419 RepID=A0ABR4N4M5_9FUNG|nr:Meiotic Sister-Chromatid recombination aldehyde dehydrogenase [Polyrhizophydium stewartii]